MIEQLSLPAFFRYQGMAPMLPSRAEPACLATRCRTDLASPRAAASWRIVERHDATGGVLSRLAAPCLAGVLDRDPQAGPVFLV
ncbi:MAG: hypothetical protein ACK5V7_06320 [bacterium]